MIDFLSQILIVNTTSNIYLSGFFYQYYKGSVNEVDSLRCNISGYHKLKNASAGPCKTITSPPVFCPVDQSWWCSSPWGALSGQVSSSWPQDKALNERVMKRILSTLRNINGFCNSGDYFIQCGLSVLLSFIFPVGFVWKFTPRVWGFWYRHRCNNTAWFNNQWRYNRHDVR